MEYTCFSELFCGIKNFLVVRYGRWYDISKIIYFSLLEKLVRAEKQPKKKFELVQKINKMKGGSF